MASTQSADFGLGIAMLCNRRVGARKAARQSLRLRAARASVGAHMPAISPTRPKRGVAQRGPLHDAHRTTPDCACGI